MRLVERGEVALHAPEVDDFDAVPAVLSPDPSESATRGRQSVEETGVLEFAIVEKDVSVGICCDRQ